MKFKICEMKYVMENEMDLKHVTKSDIESAMELNKNRNSISCLFH